MSTKWDPHKSAMGYFLRLTEQMEKERERRKAARKLRPSRKRQRWVRERPKPAMPAPVDDGIDGVERIYDLHGDCHDD